MKNPIRQSITALCVLAAILFSTRANAQDLALNKDSLLKVLYKYSFEHYNVTPNIPKEYTEKKDKYEVPADETVMAYLDASIMGNGKFGVVFGLKGLYIYNSKTSDSPGRKFLSYSVYKMSEVVRDGKNELRIGPVSIEIIGLGRTEQGKFEELLREMKTKLLR